MKIGITEYIDCAHYLPGHDKCGQLHGHTYKVEIMVEGDAGGGMVVDFSDLRAQARQVLQGYDHRSLNDLMDFPSVENICARLANDLGRALRFPFSVRVWEGQGKWAEATGGPQRA
jgi:6-pyruvoyltetrahydropterin/6-carboxytetrahydropterin synthase